MSAHTTTVTVLHVSHLTMNCILADAKKEKTNSNDFQVTEKKKHCDYTLITLLLTIQFQFSSL